MMLDYDKTLDFWESRGKNAGLDELNVTMLRDNLPELAGFIDRAEKAHLRRVLAIHKEMDVLDLGCGAGRMALHFARRCRRVVAVDFSQALLDRGRRLADERGITNIEWVRASATEFSSDEAFDVIFLGGLLPFIDDDDITPLLSRLRSILEPEGSLVSRDSVLSEKEASAPQTPAGYEVIYRRARDYVRFFRQAGFDVTYASDLYAFPAVAYAYDRLLPARMKSAAVPRAALAAVLRLEQLIDPFMLRMPRFNSLLAGRRAKIVQKITLCRRNR